MGEIVGAAIVSHVPPLVLDEDVRRELNGGEDFSIVEGLHRLRRECLDRVRPDTIIVFPANAAMRGSLSTIRPAAPHAPLRSGKRRVAAGRGTREIPARVPVAQLDRALVS